MIIRQLMVAAALLGLGAPLAAQSVKSGIAAWQHKDYNAAVKIWRPLAEKGDPDAQFNLAQAYRLGRGVPINLAAAQTWLERAARHGHVDAQTTLGLLLFQGGNRPDGIRWLKSAAGKNDPRALLVYGTALYNGDGVTRDAALGFALVSRAAAQGLAAAKATQEQMGEALSPADRKKAAALVARAKPAPKVASKVGASAAAKPGPATTATEKPAADKSPAGKPSPETKAAAKPAPAKSPMQTASSTAATASGAWRVQLGAFSQRSTAEALYRKLAGIAALAGRSPSYVAAGAVVRLQVGPFASRAAADEACRAIARRGQACFPVAAK